MRMVATPHRISQYGTIFTTTCRVAGPQRVRVDATHTGTAEAMIGLTLGQLLIYLTSRETLEHYREGWDQGAREVRALPAVVRQRPVSEEPGIVSAMFRATGLPPRTVALLDCVPPLVRIQLGPLFGRSWTSRATQKSSAAGTRPPRWPSTACPDPPAHTPPE